MKIAQELPSGCSCALCRTGCLCGDCAACSNPALDKEIVRFAKLLSVAVCVILFVGGFVFFVPVVALGATPTVTETVSFRVQPPENGTLPMGSIAFCVFGQGAVLVRGIYYPSVMLNQSARRVCR
jgi:hypothetical protein